MTKRQREAKLYKLLKYDSIIYVIQIQDNGLFIHLSIKYRYIYI